MYLVCRGVIWEWDIVYIYCIFRVLVKNCNEFINEKGVEVKDWWGGKFLRVVRNCKGRKYFDYVFEEGNRYDGIYKVRRFYRWYRFVILTEYLY